MKSVYAAALMLLVAAPAFAQIGGLVGQTPGGAINLDAYNANTDRVGFGETAMSPTVVATGTTQATATVLITRGSVITSCPAGAGVMLPAMSRYIPILVVNRSGGTCIVYPTVGATVESAPGTAAAVNAGVTIATNTNYFFRAISPTTWLQ